MNLSNFLSELKRRNVYKVAVAYAVAGWALSQGIAQVFPIFDVPNWGVTGIMQAIVVEFPMALAMCEPMRNSARSKEVLSVKTT